MATTDPQDERRTTEAPPPDEHPEPNPPAKHLGLDDSGDHSAPNPLEGPNLAEEHSIPSRSEEDRTPNPPSEHLSSNHSEKHLESNLSKIIELLCNFENHQKQQLQILRDITSKITNKSQPPAGEPVSHTNAQPTTEVPGEIRTKIQDWNKESRQITAGEIHDALLRGIKDGSENEDLMTAIRIFITKVPHIPNEPDIPREHHFLSHFLDMALYERRHSLSIDSRTSIDDTWEIINYRLNNVGWATPQNDRGSKYVRVEIDPICARVIHYFTEYRLLSGCRLCEIFQLFMNFLAKHRKLDQHHEELLRQQQELKRLQQELKRQQQRLDPLQQHLERQKQEQYWQQQERYQKAERAWKQDEGELFSHIFRFALGYAMEWKIFRRRKACADEFDTLQFNLRFFEIPLHNQKPDIETIKRKPERLQPLQPVREMGRIPLLRRTGSMIAERRSSVLMVYGTHMNTPYWTIFNFSGQNSPHSGNKGAEDKRQNFLDGVSHFRTWYSLLDTELQNCLLAWQKLLSEMDVGIGLKIDELCDPRALGELMRDENYSKRSEFYVRASSMLRRFMDCMEETIKDLEHCYREVNDRLEENDAPPEGKEKIQRISIQFLETHRRHFQDLINQIQRKIDMIKLLQGNLFNLTSIREASEATHQGRYIFVFTMMTIIYLPLGFVTSLFGMNNITEDSPLATSMAPFAVTFSVVAAVTYIIASGSFPFAHKTKFRPMLGPAWDWFRHLFWGGKQQQERQQEQQPYPDTELSEGVPRRYQDDDDPDPPEPSSEPRALKRFFNFFRLYGSKQRCLKWAILQPRHQLVRRLERMPLYQELSLN